jgi:mRNA-degrading endonuclease RelE of RelBE toxin-antitoxin system
MEMCCGSTVQSASGASRVGQWRVIFNRRDPDRVIDVLAVRPRGRAYRR